VTWFRPSCLDLAQAVSGPELIAYVKVSWINPGLGRLAIADVKDLDNAVFQPPAGPIGTGREQRDSVLVVGNHVVQLSTEGALRELEDPAEEPKHLSHAVVVALQAAKVRTEPAELPISYVADAQRRPVNRQVSQEWMPKTWERDLAAQPTLSPLRVGLDRPRSALLLAPMPWPAGLQACAGPGAPAVAASCAG
jgi:hypothetical protein